MFVDEVEIYVEAGKGGDGCVSFRREKYVPRGGPDGGDGGDGGSVVLRANAQMQTLLDLSRRAVYEAGNGRPGRGSNRRGANGNDRSIALPLGTIVRDAATGLALRDLTSDGETVVVARGGRGGRGNKAFATATHRTPREFETGANAEERRLKLDLKLIADVGLVGLANAGKSTLLSRLSRAHPKIADYPFTTKDPQLGIVPAGDYRRFVMADLPGLIEGAHKGVGLGDRFLRHIERTRVVAHLVDMCPPDGSRPLDAYRTIRCELAQYSSALAGKPELVVATKLDLTDAEERLAEFRSALEAPVLAISAVSGRGLDGLVGAIVRLLDEGH